MAGTERKIRIAITDDTKILRCRLLLKLIRLCGAEAVLLPVYLKINTKDEATATAHQTYVQEHLAKIDSLLQTCQGLLLPGNKHDVPPHAYNDGFIHPETQKRLAKNKAFVRFETEEYATRFALKHQLPIVGICGGMQVLNVLMGGSLIQHLPDDERVKAGGINHRDQHIKKLSKEVQKIWESNYNNYILQGTQKNIYQPTHSMRVMPDSLLASIYREIDEARDLDNIGDLSIHHQGVFEENLAPTLQATAIAPDGVVEALEHKNYPNLFLATQFHFECNVSGLAKPIVQKLVNAASK